MKKFLLLFFYFNTCFAINSTDITPPNVKPQVLECYGPVTYSGGKFRTTYWDCDAQKGNGEVYCPEGYVAIGYGTWLYTDPPDGVTHRCYLQCIQLKSSVSNCKYVDVTSDKQ